MTREFRSHAFASLLEGMHSAAMLGRQALQALDQIHVAFAEYAGSWRGTDFYADKLGDGVRRLAFEVRLRRGEDSDEIIPCATRREVKVRTTPVFAPGTLLAIVGYVDCSGNTIKLSGPDFKGKPSWREAREVVKAVLVRSYDWREVTVELDQLDLSPEAVLKARPRPRLDGFDED